jgi:Rrf2 family protein
MLMDMAIHQGQPHCNLADIAQRQNISPRYLEQIVAELKRNGLVKSVRGAHGGYRLSLPTDRIMLFDVLTILEGDLKVVEEEETFSTLERCIQENVYDPLSEKIEAYLSNVSLQHMADLSKEQDKAPMYFL